MHTPVTAEGSASVSHAAALLASILDCSDDAIVSIDIDGRVCHWNHGAEQLFGWSEAEAVGCTIDQLTVSSEIMQEGLQRIRRGEPTLQCEREVRRKDGTAIQVLTSASPWLVDGRIVGATSITIDISARKRAERDAARFAAIVASSEDTIIGVALDGEITTWNAAAELLFGYSASEAIGGNIAMLTPPGHEDERAAVLARVGSGRHTSIDTKRQRKDGSVIDVSLTISPIRDDDGRTVGASAVVRDITERKAVERGRERTLAELEEAQRIARLGTWSWDPQADEANWSTQMYEIFGRDPHLGPATSEDFFAYVHPDDRERLAQGYAQVFGGGPSWELDYTIVAGDGARRTVHALGYADATRPGCYMGTVQDVTAQRQAERERIELREASARAEAANRAKSEFLARMSHELRTPLNAIIGFSQLLKLEGLDARQSEHVDYVLTAGNHLLELINEVLDIARIEAGHMSISAEPVLLGDAVDEVLSLVAPLARDHGVTLQVTPHDLAPDRHVRADRHRLKQVLLNLLSNAIKYNRTGGSVNIMFRAEGGRIETLIADTGIGLEPEQLTRLFEPFERLGAEQTGVEGTGLGLTLSLGLAQAMGGTISVESTPGVGTTFTLELAAAKAPTGADQRGRRDRELAELPYAGKRPRILYIEDNLSNLTLVERMLERYPGVELLAAMQGILGLELAREHHPDLIVLDLHLPDMEGTHVLTRLKESPKTREIPVIVLTADATAGNAERVRKLGAAEFFTKPLDVPRFLDALAANLTSHSGEVARER